MPNNETTSPKVLNENINLIKGPSLKNGLLGLKANIKSFLIILLSQMKHKKGV